ncbi:MAG: hypothetical protein GOMPHAMPRED_002953 [Gomphillus americanus]|uniref:Extracellular serine-rich protein n=1 Tax=Gomphillus americanus TaxID=1940652 RepID=A0A8H3I664_9LECA|nr:MAG: hypothetical protein GOMPHAMPRED_002953 [Gomphillus americanus]
MLYSTALLALLPAALATTIRVDVGLGGLKFVPDTVTAAPGDVLEFHYHPKNHSVQQSSFAAPCQPLAGGFDSGFNPVASEEVAATTQHFSVTVNNTKPIWIYCAQGIHCKSGMSMVVNQPAPPSKNTLDAYRLVAANVNSTPGPVAPVGGIFSNGTASAASSASSSSSSNSTSSLALTTYTSVYSIYTTSAAGGSATTVSLAQTVTALSSSATAAASGTDSSASSTASTAVVTGNAAAGSFNVASWAVAAGVVAFGGLVF